MYSLKDMSDRLEIQNLLAAYCDAIDSRDWDALGDIFTADAVIDYTEAGGAKGGVADIKSYLDKALRQFPAYQHLIGLPRITLLGDTAKARTTLFNPMRVDQDGVPHIFFVGLWYRDELARTGKGWRIKSRYEELSYFHNLPAGFAPQG